MKGKLFLIFICIFLLCGVVYSQEKHNAGDMLIGINLDFYDLGTFFNIHGGTDFIMYGGMGLTLEYYLLNWFSFSGGIFGHGGVVIHGNNLGFGMEEQNGTASAGGIPFYLHIPIDAHVNIPGISWLYIGTGFSFNIPLFLMKDTVMDVPASKMSSFLGLHGDLGFDFMNNHGMRVIFRFSKGIINITEGYYPEPIIIGLLLQYNIKIN